MSDVYIKSSNITVFPTTRRDSASRRMSESAIASIVNKLIDKNGFVITPRIKGTTYDYSGWHAYEFDKSKSFELNIFGYYFNLSNLDDLEDLFKSKSIEKIYAHIILQEVGDKMGGIAPYIELKGTDGVDTATYSGLRINEMSTIPYSTDEQLKTLCLFTNTTYSSAGTNDPVWMVDDSSRMKFVGDSLDFQVDGGTIE